MGVTIHAREAGKDREIYISDDVHHVTLLDVTHIPIDEIDLSPIKDCSLFESLFLSHTNLTKLDLSPLKTCHVLKIVCISLNHISAFDLAPLAACPLLQNLYLDENPVKSLDLSPLALCSHLKVLHLSYLEISDIDLTPLAHCSMLSELSLMGNPFKKKIDLTPVADLPLKDLFLIPEFIQFGASEETRKKLVRLAVNSIAKIDL